MTSGHRTLKAFHSLLSEISLDINPKFHSPPTHVPLITYLSSVCCPRTISDPVLTTHLPIHLLFQPMCFLFLVHMCAHHLSNHVPAVRPSTPPSLHHPPSCSLTNPPISHLLISPTHHPSIHPFTHHPPSIHLSIYLSVRFFIHSSFVERYSGE